MYNNSFGKGFRDGIPICLGYLSISFAFGIFAVNSGLTILEVLFISMTNVTSAGQLAAVPIIVSGGSLIELASAQLVINLRYALMSVSLSQKLDETMTPLHRMAAAFVNTDEVFAVASAQKGNVGRRYMYGLITAPYFGWSIGTLLGAVAGDILPEIVTASLGVAIYGMFIAIVVPAAKAEKSTAICVLIAIVLSCAFKYLPFLSAVPDGFVIIICAVLAAAVMALVCPVKEAESDA